MDKTEFELEAIANINYGKNFYSLCPDRQRVVIRMHASGFLEDFERRRNENV